MGSFIQINNQWIQEEYNSLFIHEVQIFKKNTKKFIDINLSPVGIYHQLVVYLQGKYFLMTAVVFSIDYLKKN